ncbi:MAG: XRE family transcriptional regulator [Muribaculaceae bacterium]|nr:XRE family transcriptional regulator [Muribaculaceae bacterium]
MIHIGSEIEAELRRQGRGATWLAQRLHCDRTNVYNIFKREGIDTILLQRIGTVLGRNFFTLYCQDEINGDENDSTDV